MAYYTNLDDENFKGISDSQNCKKGIDKQKLLEDLKKYFDTTEYKFDETTREDVKRKFVGDIEETAKTRIAFGACFKNENKYILF